MLCKCGYQNNKSAKFCSECGQKLVKDIVVVSIPKMITIKDAHEKIFAKTISLTKIYDLVRTRSIPHVNANGKILLDVDETIKWWKEKLKESSKPLKLDGLRKII